MRRLYQWHWQNIPFTSFAKLSFFRRPNATFYEDFYKKFNKKYQTYHTLDEEYKYIKDRQASEISKWINSSKNNSNQRMLSVSCGNGYIESITQRQHPTIELHCTEIARNIPHFFLKTLSPGHFHAGFAPQCLPDGLKFDFIYLGNISYTMTDQEWISLLMGLRERLTAGGSIFMHESIISRFHTISEYISHLKYVSKLFLDHISGKRTVQWYGMLRTVDEHVVLCKKSGFSSLDYNVTKRQLTMKCSNCTIDNTQFIHRYFEMAERIRDSEVWLWGAGVAYEYYKKCFTNIRPRGMIIDKKYISSMQSVHGIPIVTPEKAKADKILPVVAFARACYMDELLDNIWKTFGTEVEIHRVVLNA